MHSPIAPRRSLVALLALTALIGAACSSGAAQPVQPGIDASIPIDVAIGTDKTTPRDVPKDIPVATDHVVAQDFPATDRAPLDHGPSMVDVPTLDVPTSDLASADASTADLDLRPWPTCDAPEPGAVQKTLNEIWAANPSQPTEFWSPGLFVTAVSRGACQANQACQIFVQSAETFADLAAGSQQSIKLFISATTAQYFVGIKPGDKVDVDGFAWRYNLTGQNELLIEVNLQLRGCAKVVGTGNPQPVTALLTDLTIPAYENTLGPLLVKVLTLSGKPVSTTETFGLFVTGSSFDGGAASDIVSLSPFFMQGAVFTGLTAMHLTDFSSVTGVFSVFVPDAMTKFKEIYPRTASEYAILTVH